MPKNWTPVEVRHWILKILYDVYMDSPTVSVSWGEWKVSQATEEHPSWKDIYKECEWLRYKDLIEGKFGPSHVSDVRITPAGREYVEQNLLKPSSA
jgi:hypothetical protein